MINFGLGSPSTATWKLDQSFKGWLQSIYTWFKCLSTPVIKTAAYTFDNSTFFVAANVTSSGFTITLPLAADNPGRQVSVKKIDASGNTLTVGRSGSDLIDGATTVTTTTQYDSWVFISDGISNWWII